MKKLFTVLCVLSLSACTTFKAPFVPPLGAVSVVSAPLDINYDNTKIGSKKGKASVVNVLGIVAFGDASLKNAAENGRIKIVTAADYDYTTVFGIFQKVTLTVYGE